MARASFLPLLLSASALGAHTTSPPGSIVLAYPSTNISRGNILAFGFDGGGENVASSVYGFWYNTSVALALPGGPPVGSWWTTNTQPDGASKCTVDGSNGAALSTDPAAPILASELFNTSGHPAGTYTIQWNVTYGTSTDPAVANASACDRSRLNYETWTWNASVVVDERAGQAGLQPPLTKVLQMYHPTGLVVVSGAGAGARSSWNLLLVSLGCVVLGLV